MSKFTNPNMPTATALKNSHSENVPKPNKVLMSLQTLSNESLSDSQTVDFVESAWYPQTESKVNTLTITSNLQRVIFDNISISTIKISVDIKKYIYKYTDIQIRIK